MKRYLFTSLALGALLVTAGYVAGQNQAGKAAAAPQTRLVRVATLSSVEANREFTANVQLLQMQRQGAMELNAAVERETNAAKKKELRTQLDALLAKLNENNDKMQKSYGFSLNRNYIMEIEKSHIYLQVSEEEAAKIEQAEKAAKAKK